MFGQRFGQLFAFNDAMALSDMHRSLKRLRFELRPTEPNALKTRIEQRQQALAEQLQRQFFGCDQSQPRYLFPPLKPQFTNEQLLSYGPYQRFYAALQRELEPEVQHLQSYAQDVAFGLSPELAQLVTIDRTLQEALASKARRIFAATAPLLERRFEQLKNTAQAHAEQQTSQWLNAGGWLDQFRNEMHQAIIAELDARLQPCLGLADAIDAFSLSSDKDHSL
jgi:hypothetical protein